MTNTFTTQELESIVQHYFDTVLHDTTKGKRPVVKSVEVYRESATSRTANLRVESEFEDQDLQKVKVKHDHGG